MIPISDENPRKRFPLMTVLLLGSIAYVWIFIQGAGFNMMKLATSVCNFGMVPGELTRAAALGLAVPMGNGWVCAIDADAINYWTPLSSMFLHGGWSHLLGNALFLWVFGDNVEDRMGRIRFLFFYLVCGLVAASAHVVVAPGSPVPTVGASGAISGVLGAYLMLFPRARVNMLFIFLIFIRVIPLPAWLVLLWWFGYQVLAGLPQLTQIQESAGGVAVWAHIGGFIAGALLVRFFAHDTPIKPSKVTLRH